MVVRRIRRTDRCVFAFVASTVALAPVAAQAQDLMWRVVTAPSETAPVYLGAEIWKSPLLPEAGSVDALRFAAVPATARPEPEAVAAAVRADAEMKSGASAALDEGVPATINGRIGTSFDRFAALDDARAYGSIEMAARDEVRVAARPDPRIWAPAAPLAWVAFELPTD